MIFVRTAIGKQLSLSESIKGTKKLTLNFVLNRLVKVEFTFDLNYFYYLFLFVFGHSMMHSD
jgi:hypothetical protein